MTELSQVSVERVERDELQAIWPILKPQYDKMYHHGAGDTLTEADIIGGLMSGEYEMIVGYLADGRICGSCIYRYEAREKGVACQVIGIAGWNVDEWTQPFMDYMDGLMERQGCYTLETFARRGTATKLTQLGWRTKSVLMEKRYGR